MLYLKKKWIAQLLLAALTFVLVGFNAGAEEEKDFGIKVEQMLKNQARRLFGFRKPLEGSAPATTGPYRTATQPASDQVLLADGLQVEYLTRTAGNATDMMAFYPEINPTHLITCVEGGRQTLNGGKLNPSVQRIHLTTGAVETVLRGMTSCDGIRTTPWGTILATEESGDGGAYEILDPLTTTEQTVLDRATGLVSDPGHISKRTALPRISWEGIAVLPSGVVFAGDELRPGTSIADSDGGALFKFIPTVPRSAEGPISNLNDSPLTAGNVYAMQVLVANNQFGQGGEIGRGRWIPVSAADARREADTAGATGYYRPEDLHQDPLFIDSSNPQAVRFCWTDTGSEDFSNYAEVVCAVDTTPTSATSVVVANRFVEGDLDFNSFDNLEFQPVTGNLYVIEDHDNGDIFACLPDGADRDIKTDGCVKMLSVKDSSAEPTGFIFSADGKTAYLSIQHSDDTNMPLLDGYRTDDVLKITGFRVKD
ncbi:MAG: DUF839 domain-containing protein [Candidatus Manganitrophaceae bacterium]|nr:MAG: DUF839 domain-containing protein [Candidatus Manganitrophaceae bacterium]